MDYYDFYCIDTLASDVFGDGFLWVSKSGFRCWDWLMRLSLILLLLLGDLTELSDYYSAHFYGLAYVNILLTF